jgi:hypothetical protein
VEEALAFSVEAIRVERLFLWHEEQDRIAPVAPVRLLAKAMPHCTATFYPDTGHLSTVVTHRPDMLRALRVGHDEGGP